MAVSTGMMSAQGLLLHCLAEADFQPLLGGESSESPPALVEEILQKVSFLQQSLSESQAEGILKCDENISLAEMYFGRVQMQACLLAYMASMHARYEESLNLTQMLAGTNHKIHSSAPAVEAASSQRLFMYLECKRFLGALESMETQIQQMLRTMQAPTKPSMHSGGKESTTTCSDFQELMARTDHLRQRLLIQLEQASHAEAAAYAEEMDCLHSVLGHDEKEVKQLGYQSRKLTWDSARVHANMMHDMCMAMYHAELALQTYKEDEVNLRDMINRLGSSSGSDGSFLRLQLKVVWYRLNMMQHITQYHPVVLSQCVADLASIQQFINMSAAAVADLQHLRDGIRMAAAALDKDVDSTVLDKDWLWTSLKYCTTGARPRASNTTLHTALKDMTRKERVRDGLYGHSPLAARCIETMTTSMSEMDQSRQFDSLDSVQSSVNLGAVMSTNTSVLKSNVDMPHSSSTVNSSAVSSFARDYDRTERVSGVGSSAAFGGERLVSPYHASRNACRYLDASAAPPSVVSSMGVASADMNGVAMHADARRRTSVPDGLTNIRMAIDKAKNAGSSNYEGTRLVDARQRGRWPEATQAQPGPKSNDCAFLTVNSSADVDDALSARSMPRVKPWTSNVTVLGPRSESSKVELNSLKAHEKKESAWSRFTNILNGGLYIPKVSEDAYNTSRRASRSKSPVPRSSQSTLRPRSLSPSPRSNPGHTITAPMSSAGSESVSAPLSRFMSMPVDNWVAEDVEHNQQQQQQVKQQVLDAAQQQVMPEGLMPLSTDTIVDAETEAMGRVVVPVLSTADISTHVSGVVPDESAHAQEQPVDSSCLDSGSTVSFQMFATAPASAFETAQSLTCVADTAEDRRERIAGETVAEKVGVDVRQTVGAADQVMDKQQRDAGALVILDNAQQTGNTATPAVAKGARVALDVDKNKAKGSSVKKCSGTADFASTRATASISATQSKPSAVTRTNKVQQEPRKAAAKPDIKASSASGAHSMKAKQVQPESSKAAIKADTKVSSAIAARSMKPKQESRLPVLGSSVNTSKAGDHGTRGNTSLASASVAGEKTAAVKRTWSKNDADSPLNGGAPKAMKPASKNAVAPVDRPTTTDVPATAAHTISKENGDVSALKKPDNAADCLVAGCANSLAGCSNVQGPSVSNTPNQSPDFHFDQVPAHVQDSFRSHQNEQHVEDAHAVRPGGLQRMLSGPLDMYRPDHSLVRTSVQPVQFSAPLALSSHQYGVQCEDDDDIDYFESWCCAPEEGVLFRHLSQQRMDADVVIQPQAPLAYAGDHHHDQQQQPAQERGRAASLRVAVIPRQAASSTVRTKHQDGQSTARSHLAKDLQYRMTVLWGSLTSSKPKELVKEHARLAQEKRILNQRCATSGRDKTPGNAIHKLFARLKSKIS